MRDREKIETRYEFLNVCKAWHKKRRKSAQIVVYRCSSFTIPWPTQSLFSDKDGYCQSFTCSHFLVRYPSYPAAAKGPKRCNVQFFLLTKEIAYNGYLMDLSGLCFPARRWIIFILFRRLESRNLWEFLLTMQKLFFVSRDIKHIFHVLLFRGCHFR